MPFLNAIFKVIKLFLTSVWPIFTGILSFFFGSFHYQAPAWLRFIIAKLGGNVANFRAKLNAKPLKSLGVMAVLLALGAGAWQGYKLYEARPKPQMVNIKLTAPTRTVIEENLPPNPLVLVFDHSVAPIALVGKDLTEGISLMPVLQGTWHWDSENTLTFKPKTDWPVGITHKVSLSTKALTPKTLLEKSNLEFISPAFVATITSSEFYQDPTNPAMKKAVINLNFSHPVDTAKLEKSIRLNMRSAQKSLLDFASDNTPFVVSYDKLKLKAYIHSATLNIPNDDSVLDVTISEDLKAARGGKPFETALTQSINVPGLYSLQLSDIAPAVVSNEQNEPEQILVLTASAAVHEKEMASHIKAWVLPRDKPNSKPEELKYPHVWGEQEITPSLLATGQALDLQQIPAERENIEVHSFKYKANVGSYIYVQVDKGLKSFGGYQLGKVSARVLQVPPFPAEVKILSQGSLLALSGERKVAILTRDLPGVQMEIGRILPGQLQHLISQSNGTFSSPEFTGTIDADNLTERFEKSIPLQLEPGKAHYEALDLSEYLGKTETGKTSINKAQDKRGIFLLTVHGYKPKTAAEKQAEANAGNASEPVNETDGAESDNTNQATPDADTQTVANPEQYNDKRLILVTDLGLIAKKELDGTQVVYVQSIHTGLPVTGATVDVIAKNGAVIFSQTTDVNGRANFAKLDGLQRERAPVLYLVKKVGDLSFLPINHYDRNLDYSRFDVGGAANAASSDSLNAYLFSDRGIYRPGDTMHIGVIVKTATWDKALDGLPLEAQILDSRGLTVKKQTIRLGNGGFNELEYKTLETAPTGTYTVNVYSVKDNNAYQQLGSVAVKVQEFLPDRMKVKTLFATEKNGATTLYPENNEGWLNPKDLKANVNVQNLFGTPAENRRVTATLTLSPAYPAFSAYSEYAFYDPLRAKEGYSETLSDATSNAEGVAEFKLGLEKYAKATYRLNILTQAFEAGGGRGVSSEAATLISEQTYLVGFKADGDLNYISKASKRDVELIAVNSTLQKVAADGLSLNFVERKYVSMLIKQSNGTFKYESRKKEVILKETPYAIKGLGNRLNLATETPGDFAYVLKNKEGLELNRVEYSVAGLGNVSRSLERNAELQLVLDKKDYKAGEDISVSIRAPYIGAGLITIERDKVYAQQWFKVDTQSSVQTIKLPADFEGNGYVSVQFVRDPSSDEIFTSPLSYGVVPFVTSLAQRSNTLKLTSQPLIKPGQVLKMKLEAAKPGRAVVFAVDEGILQVARYQNPNALGYFFQKRQLEVGTSQILDMILPEFKKIMAATAPGGDGDGALGKHLNPFKRKTDKPAVYWSGIVDVNGSKEFEYTVPETFNGKLRLLAVMVNDASIGVADGAATVRGDFVLSPNAPLTVTPGDTFDVSVGVANNVQGSGQDAAVSLSLVASPAFELVGTHKQTLKISEMHEGVALYKLKVKEGAAAKLGSARLDFVAQINNQKSGQKIAKLATEISIRPATPHLTILQTGSFKGDTQVTLKRSMFAEYRVVQASVSPLPLVAAGGLLDYLSNYEHSCTEQLVSQVLPMIVLNKRPELLASVQNRKKGSFENALNVLRSRQNAEGGFGLWNASVSADEFASVYAVHMLIEARDHANAGEAVPADMLKRGLDYLQTLAASPANSLDDARVRAYAIYLLTREGNVTTPMLASLRATLDAKALTVSNFKDWKSDLTAAYLAASYQLLQQQQLAAELITKPIKLLTASSVAPLYGHYYDDVVRNAQTLYLVSRHFPDRVKSLNEHALTNIMQPISAGRYNTLSSSYALLGFDAYANVAGEKALAKMSISAINQQGKISALNLPANIAPLVNIAPDTARLSFKGPSGLPLFYAVTESGFDVKAPASELKQGLEVYREYTDDKGQPLKAIKMGDEITVHIKMRALEGSYDDVAIVDMLPGGFEPVLQAAVSETDASITPEGYGEEGGAPGQSQTWTSPLGIGGWQPTYADIREDRLVFYGAVSTTITEFTYKIKATNSGQFVVPPAYAESMYNRLLQARSLPSSLTVKRVVK
ncbi:MAG: alpha-2-macroglobulin [Bdellovibrio sp.]|nr:alpha-2-macroglobulin [Methylotenera sp.]